ncbi:MAG TPA: DUF305 domain-containing protein [Flavobacterium sp.]|jgi:uncharacterized protein (DUF305 family)
MNVNLLLSISVLAFIFGACRRDPSSEPIQKATSFDPTAVTTSMAEPEPPAENIFKASMNLMISALSSMELTEDFDVDYLKILVVLRQGAIELAKMEMAQGKNEKLKEEAKNILAVHQEDQDKIKKILESIEAKPGATSSMLLHDALADMIIKMKNMSMSENVDKDYVNMSVVLHSGSIAVHKMELAHGVNPQYKKIADKGRAIDENDMRTLQVWAQAK